MKKGIEIIETDSLIVIPYDPQIEICAGRELSYAEYVNFAVMKYLGHRVDMTEAPMGVPGVEPSAHLLELFERAR